MVLSPAGLISERNCAGEAQQYSTDPPSRQRGHHKIMNRQLSKEKFKEKEKLVTGPDSGPPGQTGQLTIGRKITLTSTLGGHKHGVLTTLLCE
jgi:hypothetical protein